MLVLFENIKLACTCTEKDLLQYWWMVQLDDLECWYLSLYWLLLNKQVT